jgi:RES domain-containing protein
MMRRKKSAPVRLTPHPDSERVAKGIGRCVPLAVSWSGDLFRATGQDYANERDVVTGEGSRKAGARYNGKGFCRALYNALDMATAIAETLAYSRQQGIPDADALPLTLVSFRALHVRALDLTSGEVRQALGISKERLLQPWRPDQHAGREALTQALGRLARAAGMQGILYDSAHVPGGRNMVLFPDLLRPGQLKLVNKDKLPLRRRRRKRS